MQGLFYGDIQPVFTILLIVSRRGKAIRLSYDHKGTDEAEGRRIAAAGGLILNSRVNGIVHNFSY
jgi:serine/threonine protein phosphatase PrpC